MGSNYELKEINIKNHTSYYFDDQIKFKDFDLDNILIEEKSYKNILVDYISSKTWIVDKPLCIKFNKVDECVRVYDGNSYLVFIYTVVDIYTVLNIEFFLVRIFLYSDWKRRFTWQLFVFSPNTGKYGPEKLRIWTLFTQCIMPFTIGLDIL